MTARRSEKVVRSHSWDCTPRISATIRWTRRRDRGAGVAPPRVADKMLAGSCQTGQRLDIAGIARKCGEIPALRLGRELGAHSFLERARRPRQTFGSPEFHANVGKGAPACRLQ